MLYTIKIKSTYQKHQQSLATKINDIMITNTYIQQNSINNTEIKNLPKSNNKMLTFGDLNSKHTSWNCPTPKQLQHTFSS